MNLARFLLYVQYNTQDCPQDIHPLRWKAMLKWYDLNRQHAIQQYEDDYRLMEILRERLWCKV